MLVYFFSVYLEKVELFKLYNSLLIEFVDYKPNPKCNKINVYYKVLSDKKKDLFIEEDKLKELSQKFGNEIQGYYKNALSIESKDDQLESFFKILYLKCLLEYYKKEDIEVFNKHAFPPAGDGTKELVEEIKSVVSSISGERREKMLSNYENVFVKNGNFIITEESFGITDEEIPVTMVDKYPQRSFIALFNQGRFSLLKKFINTDVGLKKFLDVVFSEKLYCTGEKWECFVDKDIAVRIKNTDLSSYKESDDLLKTLCKD